MDIFRYAEIFGSRWAPLHILLAILAFCVFLFSFILGILFLIEESQIKRKKISRFLKRFPSLESLDQIHYRVLRYGFILLTLEMITGAAWAKEVRGVYFFNDPKQLWSIISWLIYGLFFQARFSAGWRGRKGIILSLIGFATVIMTFLGVKHL